jgi:glycosyltransferase involved in cell wall biosynthesis
MRICQVEPGILEIKPIGKMGWGAVEKIIREYKSSFEKLGHEVDIKYLNDADPNKYDIIHIHMANLCIEAKNRGIPYIFSLHDHHTEYNGKDSFIYKQNLEAMKGSVFSITHAEHLIEYFSETDKLFYVSHGVNTDFFTPKKNINIPKHKLLMVANNGLSGNQGIDRKGFRVAIESAKELKLPITIVGAEANKEFFAIHKDLLDYDKLTIIDTNPTEDELLKIFHNHTIFLHPSFLEAGHPNLTLLEAFSCCLPIVGTYRGSKDISSMYVIQEPLPKNLTPFIVDGIKHIISNYYAWEDISNEKRLEFDWINVCKELSKMYANVIEFQNAVSSDETRKKYLQLYNKTI